MAIKSYQRCPCAVLSLLAEAWVWGQSLGFSFRGFFAGPCMHACRQTVFRYPILKLAHTSVRFSVLATGLDGSPANSGLDSSAAALAATATGERLPVNSI